MIRMVNVWNIHQWLLGASLDDFEGDEWRARPEGANPALWQIGHVLSTRRFLGGLLGMEVAPNESDEHFGAGSDPERLPGTLSGSDLLREFSAFHVEFVKHLESLDEEELAAPVEEEFPMMPQTRLGALQFLLMHESYHIGQLGQLRVQLGKEPWMKKLG